MKYPQATKLSILALLDKSGALTISEIACFFGYTNHVYVSRALNAFRSKLSYYERCDLVHSAMDAHYARRYALTASGRRFLQYSREVLTV